MKETDSDTKRASLAAAAETPRVAQPLVRLKAAEASLRGKHLTEH